MHLTCLRSRQLLPQAVVESESPASRAAREEREAKQAQVERETAEGLRDAQGMRYGLTQMKKGEDGGGGGKGRLGVGRVEKKGGKEERKKYGSQEM
jgi:hypothetical protein